MLVGVEDGNNPPGDDEIEIHAKVNDANEAPVFDPTIDLTRKSKKPKFCSFLSLMMRMQPYQTIIGRS